MRIEEPKAAAEYSQYKYYHQVFKHEPGDWKVSFTVYGNYQGQNFKIFKDNNKADINQGEKYEDFVEKIDIKMKYFDHSQNKIIEGIWVHGHRLKILKDYLMYLV